MKFIIKGKSIKELLEEFGTGSSGFYPQNWHKTESFFTEKPEAGEYDIDFDTDLTNLTYSEQLNKLPNQYVFLHPAVLCEAILTHFKKTRVRLLETKYSRTSVIGSDGRRVLVGGFGAGGLYVSRWRDGDRVGGFGVSAGRKISSLNTKTLDTFESLFLESAIKVVEKAGYIVSQPIKK